MKLLRYCTTVALIVAANSGAFSSAFAADPVFPPGARVGVTPLVGLNKAKTFIGFETEDQGVKVLIADLPAEAYGEVANAFKAAPGGVGGIKPESIETAAGLAYYTVENAKDGAARIYTDDAVRQMFASAVIRNEVPVEEQLGLLPFKISELSSFKNIRTLAPGAALI